MVQDFSSSEGELDAAELGFRFWTCGLCDSVLSQLLAQSSKQQESAGSHLKHLSTRDHLQHHARSGGRPRKQAPSPGAQVQGRRKRPRRDRCCPIEEIP